MDKKSIEQVLRNVIRLLSDDPQVITDIPTDELVATAQSKVFAYVERKEAEIKGLREQLSNAKFESDAMKSYFETEDDFD